MCTPFGPKNCGYGKEDTRSKGRLVNYQSLSPTLTHIPWVYFLMNRFKTSKKLWSRPCGEWLAIYWEKNYTWLLPSWYWSDGTEVTLDGERDTQKVFLVPTSLCVSSKGHRGAHVPMEETERYLDRVKGHRGQRFINQWQMARIRDFHEGCQHIKLKLLNGTHHTQQSLVQGTQTNHSSVETGEDPEKSGSIWGLSTAEVLRA